jgi:hypothetical protein
LDRDLAMIAIQDGPESFIAEAVGSMMAGHERRVFRSLMSWFGVASNGNFRARNPWFMGSMHASSLPRGMLRRLPSSVFEGELATTLGYDQTLAEAATGTAREADDVTFGPNLVATFPLDGVTLSALAKSAVYRRTYDQGDHSTVRNVASLVQKAAAEWSQRMGTLEAAPVGDNYDLSPYSGILRVICLPMVPWVPLGAATAEVAVGLRAACSYPEFASWLTTNEGAWLDR